MYQLEYIGRQPALLAYFKDDRERLKFMFWWLVIYEEDNRNRLIDR